MRRIYINLVAFVVLTGATITWSAVNFLHIDFVERPDIVTAQFAESPGLRAGYEVTYLGHAVGRIRSVELQDGMSEIRLAIDRGEDLPADVTAAARRRSAIGEPYVDLSPAPGTDPDAGPRLADGDTIPLANTSSPLQYGDLFRSLDTLIETIDADALAVVTDELAKAVDGRGEDLRGLVVGAEELTTTLSENGDQIEQLIDGVAEITGVLADNRDALGSSIDSLAGLTQALEEARPSIETLVDEAPSSIALMNAIIDAADHAVICSVDGLASLDAILTTESLASVVTLLEGSAAFADVMGLVQDPRDGVFRLYLSPSGGTPPTVEYAEPAPYPGVPPRPSCPAHAVEIERAGLADQAGPGPGGQRPGAGGPGAEAPGRDLADDLFDTGSSDVEAGEPFATRVLSSAWPWLPIALLIGGAAMWWYSRRSRAA